jgi:putative RNA 2'-phosphotransferase
MNPIKVSKFLSLILHHRPETIGITLDAEGWADIEVLLSGMARKGTTISREQLAEIVDTNDKRRFTFNEDGTMIRAVQGHSREVELGYEPVEPPRELFHGTVEKFLPAIRNEGLKHQRRQHVHLSPDKATASRVGARRGQPIILSINSAAMHADGHDFYQADNGVWLTDHVPPRYILDWNSD